MPPGGPRLEQFAGVDDRGVPLFRVTNTPGRGYCGWAAIAMAVHGRFDMAVNLRSELLAAFNQLDEAARLQIMQDIEDHELGELAERDFLHMQRMPHTLLALPDERPLAGDTGYAADLHLVGMWTVARLNNWRIHYWTPTHDGGVELHDRINDDATGQVINIYHTRHVDHWEALIPEDALPNFGLAVPVEPSVDMTQSTKDDEAEWEAAVVDP